MEESLKNAIKLLSEKYEIEPTKLRIKISKPNKDLEYHVMENSEIIDKTNLATALNLNTLKAFAVGVKLNSVFNKLSEENQILKSSMNVRIYTDSQDCTPKLYLFDDTIAKRKVALSEFENLVNN